MVVNNGHNGIEASEIAVKSHGFVKKVGWAVGQMVGL
jgi:hypothetical protein